MKRDYQSFGFKPDFKSLIPDGPKNAKSDLIAKWYNSMVPMLNEAMRSGIEIDMTSPYWYNWNNSEIKVYSYTGKFEKDENKVYHEIDAKTVSTMKSNKLYMPTFFSDCWQYLRRYETEKEILKPEYEDVRKMIDKVRNLESHLHCEVGCCSELNLSKPFGWRELKEIADCMKAGKTYKTEYTFSEKFGHIDWNGRADGVHSGWYEIVNVNGHFEFPVKTNPLCWDGHLTCNNGYSRKEVSRLGMSGAGVRTKRYGNLTAKYLNNSGIMEVVHKYILKDTVTETAVNKLPEVMDPNIYGTDGFTYSIKERCRIKRLCEPEVKDSQRMKKLIDMKNPGVSVCAKITDPYKAARRYISACKILGISPLLNENKTGFTGPYAIFGNRAVELGCPIDAIAE